MICQRHLTSIMFAQLPTTPIITYLSLIMKWDLYIVNYRYKGYKFSRVYGCGRRGARAVARGLPSH